MNLLRLLDQLLIIIYYLQVFSFQTNRTSMFISSASNLIRLHYIPYNSKYYVFIKCSKLLANNFNYSNKFNSMINK